MKKISVLLFVLVSCFAQAQHKTENVILITLDGMRWQEIFTGAEKRLMVKKFIQTDSESTAKKFWDDDVNKRRKLLMPFLWSTVAQQGQLYGNRNLGSKVNVSNNQWFSYPGYSELLCGFADNERIHSNDKFENPNKTVLEFINQQKGFEGKVAAFTSWDVFPYIINAKRSGVFVSSGIVKAEGNINDNEKLLNELMYEVPNPLGDVRLDGFTFHYAFEYLKKNNPRALYIAFDETDDFAHGGKYDLYLNSAHYIDGFINKLWTWIQSSEKYKNKTTIIITADHGRGNKTDEDWKHHGSKMPECDQIWIAAIGPDTEALGEMKNNNQLYQNQIAKTLASFLGLDYVNEPKPGEVISTVIKK